MISLGHSHETGRRRFSLRALLGVHGAAAAVTELAANAPVLAAVVATAAAFVLLQLGVLAACTTHVPRAAA
jgi:hypothetical protein